MSSRSWGSRSVSNPFLVTSSFLLGLVVGSFCNVCIHRLPQGESIVIPRSRCPNCRTSIKAHDNIPVLSFLLLRRQCRSCGHRISWQYPVVELLTGSLFALTIFRFGLSWHTGILWAFVAALVIVTFIDLEHQIVPDVITLPGIAVGLTWSVLAALLLTNDHGAPLSFSPPTPLDALLGMLVGGGILYLVAVFSRGGMGGGDIKLTAMVGALLGWRAALLTIFLGTLSGSVIALVLLASGKKSRKDPMPFGPFLALGAVLALFWGEELIAGYLRLVRWGL
ncbi:MAG: prepilin peptidase [candidate division NC10 bacterium]|nr:prepilin peptidase [candidate division NC10 bacterium]